MPSSSFTALKADLDDACDFLRAFTLGQQGFTRRDGVAGIERVTMQCNQLTRLFGSGPHGKQAATVVASARTRVAAAEARMAILDKKKGIKNS